MAKASDVKSGNMLRFNGELVQVTEFLHRTPGNLRAFYQARMRNVKTGKIAEYRFRTDEEVEIARVETNDYQYLYEEGDFFVVMDNRNYEQFNIPKHRSKEHTSELQSLMRHSYAVFCLKNKKQQNT